MRVRAFLLGAVVLLLAVSGLTSAASAQEAPHPTKLGEECIEILEDGKDPSACQEAPSPILPATNEIIWGVLSFLALLFLMWRFAFPGLKKSLAARSDRIRDDLDDAERTRGEAEGILEDYRLQLADAKNESSRIIDEARQTAEQMRRDLMVRAEAEVTELRDRTRQEISAAQERAVADLRTQVSELAIGAAEVVVQRNLDRDTNRALVERFIEQVGTSA